MKTACLLFFLMISCAALMLGQVMRYAPRARIPTNISRDSAKRSQRSSLPSARSG